MCKEEVLLRDCITSPWAGEVGNPVEGPPLCTFTITQGISQSEAKPINSCFKEKPGPEVAVITFRPAKDAPKMAPILAISSSIWINFPPSCGNLLDRKSTR